MKEGRELFDHWLTRLGDKNEVLVRVATKQIRGMLLQHPDWENTLSSEQQNLLDVGLAELGKWPVKPPIPLQDDAKARFLRNLERLVDKNPDISKVALRRVLEDLQTHPDWHADIPEERRRFIEEREEGGVT